MYNRILFIPSIPVWSGARFIRPLCLCFVLLRMATPENSAIPVSIVFLFQFSLDLFVFIILIYTLVWYLHCFSDVPFHVMWQR